MSASFWTDKYSTIIRAAIKLNWEKTFNDTRSNEHIWHKTNEMFHDQILFQYTLNKKKCQQLEYMIQ